MYVFKFSNFGRDFKNCKYLKKMKKSGCWGGHLELLAVAHAFNVDVVIHQVNR
jgi:hypothetical protein